jgi:hypothetical protein
MPVVCRYATNSYAHMLLVIKFEFILSVLYALTGFSSVLSLSPEQNKSCRNAHLMLLPLPLWYNDV